MPSYRSRTTLAALAVTGLSLLAACSGQPPQALQAAPGAPGANDGLALMAGPPEAPQTLGQLGFGTAQLSNGRTPLYLSGSMAAAVRDGESAATAVLRSLGGAYRLAADTTLQPVSDSQDEQGRRYLKLRQLHRGLPVEGGEIVVQADASGAVTAVIGELVPDLRLDPAAAKLGGDEAIQRGLATLLPKTGPQIQVVHEAPKLIVAAAPDGDSTGVPRLAYRSLVEYVGEKGLALEELIVSADDGAVLGRSSHVYDALNRTLYDLGGKCIGLGGTLPGTSKRTEGAAAATDRAINDVYDQQSATYWFYKHMFDRDSYDNMGAPLKATVHVQFPGFPCSPNNAAWLASPYFQMAYGDGDSKILKDLTLGLDVTAHEITHALTSSTSNLEYKNESGALNEAMSDIVGSTVEAWTGGGGGVMGNPATLAASSETWLLGKEVAGPMLPGGSLRFMDNPTKDGASKDYYPERIMPGGVDNGGVHLNSGMPNLVHVLLTDGGKHPRGKTTAEVQGIGLEKSIRIFFLTNTKLLTSKATFETARYATAQAAENLYGRCSTEWINVHRAWDAVGAPGYWLTCTRSPGTF